MRTIEILYGERNQVFVVLLLENSKIKVNKEFKTIPVNLRIISERWIIDGENLLDAA